MKDLAIAEFENQLVELADLMPHLVNAGWQEDAAFAQIERWILELEMGADFDLLYPRARAIASTSPFKHYH